MYQLQSTPPGSVTGLSHLHTRGVFMATGVRLCALVVCVLFPQALWLLQTKLVRAIVRRAFNRWHATARGCTKVQRFASKYWLNGNLHTAFQKWQRVTVHDRHMHGVLQRFYCALQRTRRHIVRAHFLHWRRTAARTAHEEAQTSAAQRSAHHHYRLMLLSGRRRVLLEWRAVARRSKRQRVAAVALAVRWSRLEAAVAFRHWQRRTVLSRALARLRKGYARHRDLLASRAAFQRWAGVARQAGALERCFTALERQRLRHAMSRWHSFQAAGHSYWRWRCQQTERELERTQRKFDEQRGEWTRLGELSNKTWQEMVIADRNDRQAEVNEFISQWRGTVRKAQAASKRYKELHAALQERAATRGRPAARAAAAEEVPRVLLREDAPVAAQGSAALGGDGAQLRAAAHQDGPHERASGGAADRGRPRAGAGQGRRRRRQRRDGAGRRAGAVQAALNLGPGVAACQVPPGEAAASGG
jgi:hypothetical protein